jgi:6-phosphogluconolactonase
MMRFKQRKHFGLLFVTLLALILGLAACKLTSGGGGLAPPPSGSMEYLFATSKNQVWSFNINTTTGALSGPASITGPALSEGIVGNPAGTFLYVSDSVNDQVHVYTISTSGTLSEIGSSPYTVGTPSNTLNSAAGLAMDSAGKVLYAADQLNNDVAGFTVNSSGALTAATNSPFATSTTPTQVVVDASSQFVYVPDFNNVQGGISAFTLSSVSTGNLVPVAGFSPFTTDLNGGPLGVATIGRFLYVTEQNKNVVVGLSISSPTGALAPLPNSPYAAGSQPTGIVVSPSGKYVYAANNGDATISGYQVNADGSLSAMANSPFAATVAPWYLAIDPSGKFLYATNPGNGTITGFTISSTGALAQFSGSATTAGTQPVSLTVVTVP